LSSGYPDLITLRAVEKVLEAMQENEKFMSAIEDDLL
jgi:hypothetical protein